MQLNVACFSLSCLWIKGKHLEGSTTMWLGFEENKALVRGRFSLPVNWEKKFFIPCVEVIALKGLIRQV